MSIKKRLYFTQWPQTSASPGFAKHNHPTAEMFATLFDSIAFKLNYEDKATESSQGLAMSATDANVYSFISKTGTTTGTDFVRPHQIPEIALDADSLKDDAYTHENGIGIKRTKPARTGGGGVKYSISAFLYELGALEFYEEGIHLKGDQSVPAIGDYYFGKKNNAFGFYPASSAGASSYWRLTNGMLYPTSSEYGINAGSNYAYASRFVVNESDYPTIYTATPTSAGNGKNLYVRAAHGYQIGDNGGSLYLFGGSAQGGGVNGNVVLCHSGTGGVVGVAAVGGAPHASYMLKVYGNMYVTGTLTVEGSAGGGGSPVNVVTLDASGVVTARSLAQAREDILPEGTAGKMILHNGTVWTASSLTGPIAIDGTGLTSIANGSITNAMIANTGISVARIYGSTGGKLVVTNSETKFMEESSVRAADISLVAGLSTAGVTANDLLATKGLSGIAAFGDNGVEFKKAIKENIAVVSASTSAYNVALTDRIVIIKVAANGTTLNLPEIANAEKQVVRFVIQTQQGTPKDVIFDSAGTNSISYNGSESGGLGIVTISAPAAGTVLELYAAETGVWTLVKM